MITRVYMVRHAESEGNACRRCHAQFDGIITRKGMEQAEALALCFKDIPVSAIYSSDSYRSRMTAAPLARDKGLDVQYRMLLREYTIGCWEGLAIGDAARRFPEKWARWGATPYDHDIPGADRFETVAERGEEIIRRMAAENPGGTVVAVTHSCTLTCALTRLLGQPISYYTSVKSGDNTAVTLIEVDEDGGLTPVFINDDSHLPKHLLRANYTGRSAATNMAFDHVSLPADAERAIEQYSYALAYALEGEDTRDEAMRAVRAALAQDARFAIFPMLLERTCGLILLACGDGLPDDCGEVTLFHVAPDLRPKGYCEQALGEAIDVLRRAGKRYLIMRESADADHSAMTRRFRFEPAPEKQGYVRLRITVDGIDGPVY